MSHPLALSVSSNAVHVTVSRNRHSVVFVQSIVRKDEGKYGRLSDVQLSEGMNCSIQISYDIMLISISYDFTKCHMSSVKLLRINFSLTCLVSRNIIGGNVNVRKNISLCFVNTVYGH
jgi:hypothetical protein